MDPLLIRTAGPGDIPVIRALAERTWWPAYRDILAEEQIRYMLDALYSQEALLEQMESGHNFLLLVEGGNPADSPHSHGEDPRNVSPLGSIPQNAATQDNAMQNATARGDAETFLGFASWSLMPGTVTCRLHKIYVLPETQGKGAGRFLLNAVETQARAHNCLLLELNVNRFNKARGFYEKLGFSIQRTEDIPIGPFFMNDYIMQKTL